MNIREYEAGGKERYQRLAAAVRDVLTEVLSAMPDVRVLVIQHRSKDLTSLRKKMSMRKVAEDDALEPSVKDLAGCRIIAYTNADVQRLLGSSIIRENFDVDWDRTKIHYPLDDTDADQLFVSYNYVLKLKPAHLQADRADLEGMFCEVQVQTILDHAWSEMAHDTIYKPPAPGLGKEQVAAIRKRMTDTMREHLLPAGFDFQKIAHDAARLREAQELEERDPLKLLTEAADNPTRYHLLTSFRDILVPHYDALAPVAVRVRRVMQEVAAAACREEADAERDMYNYASASTILRKVCEVLDRFRFVDEAAIASTFESLVELYRGAVHDDERQTVLKSAERLAEHNLHIWEAYGPVVERLLLDHIIALSPDVIGDVKPMIIQTLSYVLRTEVSGTTGGFDVVTFHQGSVVPSRELDCVRERATQMLEDLFDKAGTDEERRELMQAIHAGTSVARKGDPKPAMYAMVLRTAARFTRFFMERWSDQSFDMRVAIERKVMRLHQHLGTHGGFKRSRDVKHALAEFKLAIGGFRRINDIEPDYVVFKTLVPFDEVLATYWDGDRHDRDYRDEEIVRLVGEIDEATLETWRRRIERCATSPQQDGADHVYFAKFLRRFAKEKPDLAFSLVAPPMARIDRHLDELLAGFDGGAREADVLRIVDGWIGEGRNLSAVAVYYWRSPGFDKARFLSVYRAAVRHVDMRALHACLRTASERYLDHPDLLASVMLPAITVFSVQAGPGWVDAVAFSKSGLRAMEELSEAQARKVMEAVVLAPELTHWVEAVIARIAPKHPSLFVDLLERRLAAQEREDRDRSFEATPHEFQVLTDHMAGLEDVLVAAARRWFAADREAFRARRGAAIAGLFPETLPIETALAAYLQTGEHDDIAFAVAVLSSYFDGASATSTICRDIVAALPAEDELLEDVSMIIERSGLLSGAFGGVEAKQAKRDYMQTWLEDSRAQVRVFAEIQIRDLERGIAADQRRSMEQLQLRKRHWGVA